MLSRNNGITEKKKKKKRENASKTMKNILKNYESKFRKQNFQL